MNFYKLKKKGEEDYNKYISNKEKKKKVDKNFLYEDEYIHIKKSRDRKSEVSINDGEYELKKKKNSYLYENKYNDNNMMGINNMNNKIYKDKMNKHISNHKKNHNRNIHKDNNEESNSEGFLWSYMKNIYSSVSTAVKNNIFTNDKKNNINDISSFKTKSISNNSRLIDKNVKKNKNNRDLHINEYKYDYVQEKFKDNISSFHKRHEKNYKKIYEHNYNDEEEDDEDEEKEEEYDEKGKKKEIQKKKKKKKDHNIYYDLSENDLNFLFKSDNDDYNNNNNIKYENNLIHMNTVKKDEKVMNTLYNDILHVTDENIYMDHNKKKKSQIINKNIYHDNIIEHDKSKQKNGHDEDNFFFNNRKSHLNVQKGVRQKGYHDNKNIYDNNSNNNKKNYSNNNNDVHSFFNKKDGHTSTNLYNININDKNDFFLHSSDEEQEKKYTKNLEIKKEKTNNHVILSNKNSDERKSMDHMKHSKSSVRNINIVNNDHNREDEMIFKTHTQNHNSTEKLYYENIFEEINKDTNVLQHVKENTSSNVKTNIVKDKNEKINNIDNIDNIDNHIKNKNSDIQNDKELHVEYDMSSNLCDKNNFLNTTTPITDNGSNDVYNINSNNHSKILNKEDVFNDDTIKDNDELKKLRYEYKNLINIIDSFIDETLNSDVHKNSPVYKENVNKKNDKIYITNKDDFLNDKNNYNDDDVYNSFDDDYENSMKLIEDTSSEDKNKYVILKYDEDSLIEALEKLRIDKKKINNKLIKLKDKYQEDIERDEFDDDKKKKKIDKNIFFKCSKKEYYEKAIIILNEKIENRVLIEKFNVPLLYSQIKCLIDTRWLNDEIINFYLSMLQEYNEQYIKNNSLTFIPKIFTFSTFFFQSLNFNGSYNYSKVSRWTKRKQVDIFSFDLILIPLHVGGNHWTLGSIHMKDKKICLYDSLNGSNKKFFEYMKRYIVDEMKDKKQKDLDISLWAYSKEGFSEKGIPHQENGYDCGVFTCMFAKCLSFNREFDFNQRDIKDIRLKMAYEISQGCLVF
ncbi:sentrin-specific protease 1 [Plasmodium sp. gorilla clade G2]|uniref:sentrin-specific protease 1 n=1 Tax=Plasmodium sp. gorilla clade G2 TaxID=880535 RepID=UPI000D2202FA|nr:sentrin-specific protease 1 [Plasmodium sp. gorilla clade G2]SOV16985.1 sentrin-specific protease 1 [Plasmodium sp. gorilla clade G2]